VIHNGKSSSDTVGVLIEVKRPGYNAEMISPDRPNAKALHELLHYYLGERYLRENKEIKHLIVCNIYEWYIFDAADFERFFFANKKLITAYKEWSDGLFGLKNTDWFYQEVARPFIEKELAELPCTCFDLRDFEKIIRKAGGADDKKLIALYKLLSPPHLLKQSFANDANSLNREFYNELLHIIGLEEIKEKGKKLISRKAVEKRNEGSLLENAINMLKAQRTVEQLDNPEQFGSSDEEQLFSIGLELCIIWLNRILFLKLLEGQLITYHHGDRSYAFLKSETIKDFDDLQELFFEVLARRMDERTLSVSAKFGAIPYLNSSLFEISDIERKAIQISNLKSRLEMPLHGATVLKDSAGKRISGNRSTLGYLLGFLDAYDFASEGKADIQETAKTIINASVLGLIFEKINGYRDGSFYTPGFITMYMSREAMRRAVVQKFRGQWDSIVGANCVRPGGNGNDSGNPGKGACHAPLHWDDLVDKLDYSDKDVRQKANDIINSLRLCDPAVGSGHFLVSALNEIIAIKSELHLLADCDGKRLHGCVVTIENDELIVTVEDELFVYNPKDPESRRIQETLFHEKQTIIEQCLFGVDINPKSVAICRLRLWIELLKNAYYTKESSYKELETLPNIDINIKCGNSLVSRFALRNGGSQKLSPVELNKRQQLTKRYKEAVWQYKLAPTNKAILRKEIASLKEELQSFAMPTDKDLLALRKLKNDLDQKGFGFVKEEMEQYHTLLAKETELKQVIADKLRTVYGNAFEWRFEFPEVLDEEGNYIGFDLVIGNPPFIPIEQFGENFRNLFRIKYSQVERKYDSSVLFFIEGANLLAKGGILAFIAPLTWQTGDNYSKFRRYLIDNKGLLRIINLPFNIFEEAYVDTAIYFISEEKQKDYEIFAYDKKALIDSLESIIFKRISIDSLEKTTLKLSVGVLNSNLSERMIGEGFVKLGEITKSTQGLAGSRFTKIENSGDNGFPFLEKGNVYNYSLVIDNTAIVDLSDKPSLKQFYQAEPKILIRRIINRQDRLSVAYTDEKMVFKKDINPFIPRGNQFQAKYLLAILASKFISYFYVNSSVIATKDDFRQTTLTELRSLPIPDIPPEQQAPLVALVEQIMAAKKQNHVGAIPCVRPPLGDNSKIVGNADRGDHKDPPLQSQTGIPALEAEIDRLVYALYGLTEEEIAIIES